MKVLIEQNYCNELTLSLCEQGVKPTADGHGDTISPPPALKPADVIPEPGELAHSVSDVTYIPTLVQLLMCPDSQTQLLVTLC